MWEVLRHRRFRRLFTAQVVALLGTGLLTVALALLAYDIAGRDAGLVLGTALAIKMVAYVCVAPVMSAVTDQLPRRFLLVSADAVRAGTALLLPWVTQVWQIYLLIFVLQAASATFTPAFQAVIPTLLTRTDHYTAGLSLSRLAYDGESLLSPMVAAALLTLMDNRTLFVGTAAAFMASAALVAGTALPPQPAPDRAMPLRRRLTVGTRHMVSRPVLRGLLAMNLAVSAGTAFVVVNTVVYVQDMLGETGGGVALALASYGAGSMLVALAVPRLLRAVSDRSLMLAGCTTLPIGLLAAAGIAAFPTAGWPTVTGVWALLGAGTSLITMPSARLVRAESPPELRPAVFTAQFSLSHACFLLSYPVAGWLGASVGHAEAAVALAAMATLATGAAVIAWPVNSEAEVAERR